MFELSEGKYGKKEGRQGGREDGRKDGKTEEQKERRKGGREEGRKEVRDAHLHHPFFERFQLQHSFSEGQRPTTPA